MSLATFGAFRHPEFRRFFPVFLVSLVGVWMQRVALSWLVLDLTGSAFHVGLVEAMGTVPVMVLGLVAGAVADRVSRVRLVAAAQAVGLAVGTVFAVLAFTGTATVELLVVLAFLNGIAVSFDIPARHALLFDLVGQDDLANAIALNSSAFNASRVVGPAIAGVLIGVAGVGACFATNVVSYVPVILMLLTLRLPRPAPREGPPASTWGTVQEGLRYVLGDRRIRVLAINIAVLSVFANPAFVLLPVLARNVLGRGAVAYGWMMSAVGLGAVIGALVVASLARRMPKGRVLGWAAVAFGMLIAVLGLTRPLGVILLVLMLAGAALITTTALTNTLMQSLAPDRLRGRIVSVYMLAFLGVAPLGAFLAGAAAQRWGVGVTMVVGGAVTAVFAALGVVRPGLLRDVR